MQTDFHVVIFFTFFKISAIVFEWKRGWRKRIIFKEQKFSLRALLSFCLVFCHLQPRVAYKSVAYKKTCIANLPHYSKFNMDIFSFLVIQSIIILWEKIFFSWKRKNFLTILQILFFFHILHCGYSLNSEPGKLLMDHLN